MSSYRSLAVGVLVLVGTAGCSFSDSSGSSSDIVSSPKSISKSSQSSSESKQQNYQNQVAAYTAEFVKSSSGDLSSFWLKIGELASAQGISNWQDDFNTFVGIGRGLKQADLGGPQQAAFVQSLSNNDAMKKQAIQQGLGN
jgi:hypothetical protein